MRAAYDRVMARDVPACDACKDPLALHIWGDGKRDLENEVALVLGGGYGSFIDSIHQKDYGFIFCEACAVRMCRMFGLSAPMHEHHTSTVCACPDRGPRDDRGFPLPCDHADCANTASSVGPRYG